MSQKTIGSLEQNSRGISVTVGKYHPDPSRAWMTKTPSVVVKKLL